ncbi:hypothetical protein ACEQPO_05020 [Bacillus sp. SL00103]
MLGQTKGSGRHLICHGGWSQRLWYRGANAHVILEEAEAEKSKQRRPRPKN